MAYPDDYSALATGFLNNTRMATPGTENSAVAGTHAAHHNELAVSHNAVEATLGLRPQGGYTTVAERLDAIASPAYDTLTPPTRVIRWGTGDDLSVYAAGGAASRLDIRAGSGGTIAGDGAPDTALQPLMKVQRVVRVTGAELAAVTSGDGGEYMNTLSVQTRNAADSEVQAVGLMVGARTYSTAGVHNDACALYAVGRAMAGATGSGFAAFLAGRRDDSTGRLTTLELHAFNNGADGELLTAGASSTKLIWATCAGAGQTAAVLQVGNPWGQQFRYVLHANGQIAGGKTGGVSEAVFRDDSAAKVSIDIYGSHADAALRVADTAGRVLFGGSAFNYANSRLEVQASAGTYDPLAAFFVAGRSSFGVRFANGVSAGQMLFVSGGTGNFLTGTVAGDSGIQLPTAQTWHVGANGSRGTLRVGKDNWAWGQQPDSFGGMVGGEYLADCTTSPTRAPVNGVLRYSEGGFPRLMDALGTVTKPGDNRAWSRSGEVATLHPEEAVTQLTLTSGAVYGVTARVRTTGTYTRIRFHAGTAGSGITNLRVGACDSTGTRLAQTADITALWVANRLIEATLDTPLRLTEGQILYLDIGSVATTAVTVRGLASTSDMTAIARGEAGAPRAKTATGLTAGAALSNLSGNGSNNLPWIELLP